MTLKEAQNRHEKLHRSLDELLACWITARVGSLRDASLMDFVQWSHKQTLHPHCAEAQVGHVPNDAL